MCGVVGVWRPEGPVSWAVYAGLLAAQHRGQESAGVTVGDGVALRTLRGAGLVTEVFREGSLEELSGRVGIGHVRYPTAGGDSVAGAQPLVGVTRAGEHFALAHNGNVLRIDRGSLNRRGVGYLRTGGPREREGESDSQVLTDQLAGRDEPPAQALRELLGRVHGAYCLVLATRSLLCAARDPHGFRPLCLGRLPDGGWMVASESAVLDAAGADFVRDVEPGELLVIDQDGLRSEHFAAAPPATCLFEHVYIARPDSLIGGRRVQQVRQAFGALLAARSPVAADVVVPVPDTARPAALGYARAAGIDYGEGLVRNHYLGRTFLRPGDGRRRDDVRLKLNPVPEVVRGRRVVLVDDSLVRATSMRQAVALLRRAGAAEVHVRIASATISWPCYFGVDISSQEELAGHRMSAAEIGAHVGADSLEFLSAEGMREAVGGEPSLCMGCFTGSYPTTVPAGAPASARRVPPPGRTPPPAR
ncbi:amidophosphoribosyltransferase [Acrocarpospora phusangensis]|uniref:Amidophosphoribosyltransferase n=1 Tax=Acrocarpospora phusangensis TaxID=1070424 RepID=A0A919QHU0_9ACTN|nr:amidophosphoribosyltransferase [Acrocarpospora phusangensis]GIH26472.1 amidophosphoribosyltransferase [Acrocarpospora phusangensis]